MNRLLDVNKSLCWALLPLLLLLLGLGLGAPGAQAATPTTAPLTAAVAANFRQPMEEICALYEARTGVHVTAVYASTGKLYGQIVNGAPFDLFLSADVEHPRLLFGQGLAAAPFTYARGRVVLWTARRELCRTGSWRALLQSPQVKRFALPNPRLAPYGAAAQAALEKTGLWPAIEGRVVTAESVAQAFQYAHTEAVEAAFCAQSDALSGPGRAGCWLPVAEAPVIVQDGCVLMRCPSRAEAERFSAFLKGPEALGVIKKYGYEWKHGYE